MGKIHLRGKIVLFIAVCLFMSVATAYAHTLDVTLKDSLGSAVSSTTPYSPKMTCGGCHFNCSDGSYSTDKNTWCDNSGAGKMQKDCSAAGNCPDYESAATTEVSKVQGYADSNGVTTYMTYTVKAPVHGASVGKHSTLGRNEGLVAAQRSIWGAPATISGPGMSGRY